MTKDRLFELACLWFERSQIALENGQRRDWIVATLAHDMCRVAFKQAR